MYRGIVLGDLWGIEKSVWVELWAGLLGAVPAAILSAIVAALVAMFVLERSNKHQRELVEAQMKDQRDEAARAREKTAMADLIGVANKFVAFGIGNDPAAVRALTVSFNAASFRWALEAGDSRYAKMLLGCASVFGIAGTAMAMSEGESRREEFDAIRDASRSILNEMAGLVLNFGMAWYLDSPSSRSGAVQSLAEDAKRLEERMDSLVESLPD